MKEKDQYVTTRDLAAELRAMRWEMRALIAIAGAANLAAAYKLSVPPVDTAVGFILGLLG